MMEKTRFKFESQANDDEDYDLKEKKIEDDSNKFNNNDKQTTDKMETD